MRLTVMKNSREAADLGVWPLRKCFLMGYLDRSWLQLHHGSQPTRREENEARWRRDVLFTEWSHMQKRGEATEEGENEEEPYSLLMSRDSENMKKKSLVFILLSLGKLFPWPEVCNRYGISGDIQIPQKPLTINSQLNELLNEYLPIILFKAMFLLLYFHLFKLHLFSYTITNRTNLYCVFK